MESEFVTNGLLSIIAALGGICTWFMAKVVNKVEHMETCVEALSIDLKVFKIKVAAVLNIQEDFDELPHPQPQRKKA